MPNATASITVTGPQAKTILTGPSDANGIADGIWKTSAPSRKSTGTPSGDLHGHGQRRDGKRLCLGRGSNIRDVHNTEITLQRIGSANPPLSPFAKGGLRGISRHRFPPRSSLTPSLEKGGQGRIFSFPNPGRPKPVACSLRPLAPLVTGHRSLPRSGRTRQTFSPDGIDGTDRIDEKDQGAA